MKSVVYQRFFEHMMKAAAADDEYMQRFGRVLKPLVAGTLGFGVGQAAGMGAGKLLERLDHKAAVPGARAARIIGPTAGMAAGLAHALYKQREQKEVQDALSNQTSKTPKG